MSEGKEKFLTEENPYGSLIQQIKRFLQIFKDENLRTFAYGRPILAVDDEDECINQIIDDMVNRATIFDMCYGITNAMFVCLVARFTKAITQNTDTTQSRVKQSFCIERIKDAIFGLYDTYDATDDIIQFVVYNTTLALRNDADFRRLLGFSDSDLKSHKELLPVFRWMNKWSKKRASVVSDAGLSWNLLPEYVNAMRILLDCAKFCQNIMLVQSEEDKNTCDIIFNDPDMPCAVQTRYPTNYGVLSLRNGQFFLLRSVEFNKEMQDSEMLLRYTNSNASEKMNRVDVCVYGNAGVGAELRAPYIVVDSIGQIYNHITYGLIRKRSRASFCSGLTGFKYYSELGASVIDALGSMKGFNVIKDIILPLIKSNFAACKDECVCMGTRCPYKHEQCLETKRFDDSANLREICVSNMRLLPIITLLFIVSGCNAILPQIFGYFKGETDNLIEAINEQLSLRFPKFNVEKVKNQTMSIYEKSKSALSMNLVNEDSLPDKVRRSLAKLKARAYTEAIVKALENIEDSENEKNDSSKLNVYGYNLGEQRDMIRGFKADDEKAHLEKNYAVDCLKRALKIVICYYDGLKHCWENQLEYELSVENSTNPDTAGASEWQEKIVAKFLDAAEQRGKELRSISQISELFDKFFSLAEDTKMIQAINLLLGRDVINRSKTKTVINQDGGKYFVCYYSDNKKYKVNLDDTINAIDSGTQSGAKLNELYTKLFGGIEAVLSLLYNWNTENGIIGAYPQVLTFYSKMINRDGNIMRKFLYNNSEGIAVKEYNVFTFFEYVINKRYFFMPPKKYETSNWLTHPILIDCAKFQERVFGS